jgi:hypothetical protein
MCDRWPTDGGLVCPQCESGENFGADFILDGMTAVMCLRCSIIYYYVSASFNGWKGVYGSAE